jgi:hypothetical protein
MLEKLVVISTTEGSGRAHLDYRLSHRLVVTRYRHESRLSPLQLHHQLRRLCCPDAGPPLQSPPSVARYTRSLRRWEGRCRCRRRHRCRRRPCQSLLRFPQVSHRYYKPNTSRSQSMPRIPGLSPPLSPAAAAAGREGGDFGVVGKGRKKEDERAMESRDFYTPRKRRRARARAMPDAGGRDFLMRVCRLVVYLIIYLFLFNLLNIFILKVLK